MKSLFVAAFAGLLAAGAASAIGAAGGEPPVAEKTGESRSCLSNSAIASSVVEDERTIRFEMIGRRAYRNRLSAACPELRQVAHGFGALAFELHGDSLCSGDLVRVTDPSRGRTMTLQTVAACPLGSFERLADRSARRR
jgi:hypothetical protein